MKNLTQSILNYFATFTETKFNFRTLINYKWTEDEFTLDFSLYPEFQSKLINKIKSGDLGNIEIKLNDYSIDLSGEDFLFEIKSLFNESYNLKYLDSCIEKEWDSLKEEHKVIAVSEKSEATIQNSDNNKEIEREIKVKALKAGIRKYNLGLRRSIEELLVKLQDKTIRELKEEYNIVNFPTSTFNSTNFIQNHFDNLQKIASKATTTKNYFEKINKYFNDDKQDIKIYDLYHNIVKYQAFTNAGTQYLFFHEVKRECEGDSKEGFPLYFVEVDLISDEKKATLRIVRDLLFINTPAINYFQFPSVLTTPRACCFKEAETILNTTEGFLQTHYGLNEPFIFTSQFKPIKGSSEQFPDINFRVGMQVVSKENKKILDYSELITNPDSGSAKKFTEFIKQYMGGSITNTRDEIDNEFKKKYPPKNPARYLSDIPLPVNIAQKNILLALASKKNKVVVVDGPPGTGKSHAIAAISYWANQNDKSLMITSHKKEALDVLEGMLVKNFKNLHPQSKPSIMRLVKDFPTDNNQEITLSSAVINAATDRVSDYNEDAIEKDGEVLKERLEEGLESEIASAEVYQQKIKNLLSFEILTEKLLSNNICSEDELNIPKTKEDVEINFQDISEFANNEGVVVFKNYSTTQFSTLLKYKKEIPILLESCDVMNSVSRDLIDFKPTIETINEDFYSLINEAGLNFKKEIAIKDLTDKNKSGGIGAVFKKKRSKEELEMLIKNINSLKNLKVISCLADLLGKDKKEINLNDLSEGLVRYEEFLKLQNDIERIRNFRTELKITSLDNGELYQFLEQVNNVITKLSSSLSVSIDNIFSHYGSFLTKLGIEEKDILTFSKIVDLPEEEKDIWDWIELHYALSVNSSEKKLNIDDFDQYYKLLQKKTEHKNDERFKNLNNFINEIEKIKVTLSNNKRLSLEQTKILTENLSSIIAEPEVISKYFPMENDIIDILVIDEASQVSIAESISLILRAKQVVVFGDELQYGAVSAVNVSSKYQSNYFRDVIDGYTKDFNLSISDKDKNELLEEVSAEKAEDDLIVEDINFPQNEGTIHWIKTFNIRTSTLSFAKAIANYNTSLREHFRSFKEIIDYSNEVFYKPSQIELIVNRIRTKPIEEVLKFVHVETKGNSGKNVNLDEIDAIKNDIEERIQNGFKGTIGIITSFREQKLRTEEVLRKTMKNYRELTKDHKLVVWFVGDVQGEERDIVYYSFVQDKKQENADLKTIYPVIGGTADTIKSLKMQRLNVGFSRAKDTMVFVHSMDIKEYSDTRLGEALKFYSETLERVKKNDFVVDEKDFGSPAEKELYSMLLNTEFVNKNSENVKIVLQFAIGDYLKKEFGANLPKYRTDFLMTLSKGGKEQSLILEYDGVEWHTKNPDVVNKFNFSQEYLDYDVNRQIELESYGYRFLRINKFTLLPENKNETKIDVLNRLLEDNFK